MDDDELLAQISELVDDERELRSSAAPGVGLSDKDRERLNALEVRLDRFWDLLRRRRAREEFGEDPELETPRPADVVEHYRQ